MKRNTVEIKLDLVLRVNIPSSDCFNITDIYKCSYSKTSYDTVLIIVLLCIIEKYFILVVKMC